MLFLPNSVLFLTFLFHFFILIPSAFSQNSSPTVPCASNGVWGDWGQWSSCPSQPSLPSLNVQRRIRPCSPQPAGCLPSSPYNCAGAYSEIKPCGGGGPTSSAGATPTNNSMGGAIGGGWNAQMLQSMNVNRQSVPPAGSPPAGGSSTFAAGMLQSMQINDTNGG